jgi:hypothetical protein
VGNGRLGFELYCTGISSLILIPLVHLIAVVVVSVTKASLVSDDETACFDFLLGVGVITSSEQGLNFDCYSSWCSLKIFVDGWRRGDSEHFCFAVSAPASESSEKVAGVVIDLVPFGFFPVGVAVELPRSLYKAPLQLCWWERASYISSAFLYYCSLPKMWIIPHPA